MVRKAVIIVSIISLLNFTTGCTTSSPVVVPTVGITVPPDSISRSPQRKILQANLVDGAILVYNRDGGRYKNRYQGQDSVVIGILGDGTVIITPLKEVASVKVEGREPVKAEPTSMTFLGWTGIVVGIAFVVSLVWLSNRMEGSWPE